MRRAIVALSLLTNPSVNVRAAEQLDLSQSALTRSTQAKEHNCGSRLFDRDRDEIRLARDGSALAERASLLLVSAEDLTTFMQRGALLVEGEITFRMEPLVARALLSLVLNAAITDAHAWRNRVAIRSIKTSVDHTKPGEIDFSAGAESGLSQHSATRAERLGSFR